MITAAITLTALLAARPNIVVIMADDLGVGELGCYGQQKIRTPNLDQMARDGAQFDKFYSASTVCAPTRCSLMTGKDQGHAAIRGNKEIGGWELNSGEGQEPLPTAEITIAERLRAEGYATGICGKWGLGGPGSVGRPTEQGFDFFFGYLCQRQAHNYYPTHLWKNDDVYILDKNRYFSAHQKAPKEGAVDFSAYRGGQYSVDLIEDEAIGFVRRNAQRPFFLYLAPTLPHAALQAPPELVDAYPREWDAKPYLGESGYVPCERPHATYAAMITRLDTMVGRVREALRRAGVERNTLLIFTSDNGATFNGGVDRTFFQSNGKFRGYKTQLYEGGIREPGLAVWPGQIAPGLRLKAPAYIPDIYATALAAVGARVPSGLSGINVLGWLQGKPAKVRPRFYWEFCENPSQAVLLQGRWKALRTKLAKNDLSIELYDLQNDPSEKVDVAASHPEIVRQAERAFKECRVPNPVFPLPGIDVEAKGE